MKARQAADDRDYENTSDRNELCRLTTTRFLVENDIPFEAHSSGVVTITTARGERARLSLRSGLICFTGNSWLDCKPEKLVRLCKGT